MEDFASEKKTGEEKTTPRGGMQSERPTLQDTLDVGLQREGEGRRKKKKEKRRKKKKEEERKRKRKKERKK